MNFFGPEVQALMRAQEQARMASAAAAARQQATINSLNETAQRQAAKTWSEHQRHFDSFRQRQEVADDETKAQAQKNWDEFNARLNGYRGPLDPLLELLKIKSKSPTKAEIRTAYIAAVKRTHPDIGGSEDEAKKVIAAYEILSKRFG